MKKFSNSLCRAIGAHDVLNLIVVGIQKCIRLRSQPDPLAILCTETIHHREHLALLLQDLIIVLLHMALIFDVEKLIAAFANQIGRHIAEHVHHALINKREFTIDRVT